MQNRNPLVGTDEAETAVNVRNVLEFLAWQRPEGESTPDIEDGRRLILATCAAALAVANEQDKP